jgi:hypothetical protein
VPEVTFACANLYRAPLTYRSREQLAAHLSALYPLDANEFVQQSPEILPHGSVTGLRDLGMLVGLAASFD